MIFVAVVLVGLALGRGLAAPAGLEGPLVGTTAPEVVLTQFDGSTWLLSETVGDAPIVLNLWASWCLPCVAEIPELSRFAERHRNVVVVGVAVRDDADDARSFAEELQPAYIIGMDATQRLRDAMPTIGLPATFVIDRTGTIVAQFDRPVDSGDLAAVLADIG